MAKLFEGIIDIVLPIISGGAGAVAGNPFRMPWQDDPNQEHIVTDADGTRGDEQKETDRLRDDTA
jgi:hypothetical protein